MYNTVRLTNKIKTNTNNKRLFTWKRKTKIKTKCKIPAERKKMQYVFIKFNLSSDGSVVVLWFSFVIVLLLSLYSGSNFGSGCVIISQNPKMIILIIADIRHKNNNFVHSRWVSFSRTSCNIWTITKIYKMKFNLLGIIE